MILKAFFSFFLLFGLGLLGCCWWGIFTTSGQAQFPEMAGILPYYAGGLGGAITLLTGLVYVFRRTGARDNDR